MLFPKKVAHRKWHSNRWNPRFTHNETRGTNVSYGQFGIKAETAARITSNQIEAARRVLQRTIGKTGRVFIRIFPDRPFTMKGAETPMGSGKGDPKGFVFEALPGRVLFELDNVTEVMAREAIRKAGAKLPVKTRFTVRHD